jgi:4'-phosphopantetheinyl transferase
MLPPWVGAPQPGECHIWWADAVPVRMSGLALLDRAERDRLAGYRLLADRDAFATATVLLRVAVGGYLGTPPQAVRIEQCPRRGTRLRGAGAVYALALARSGRRVGVAVSRAGPVGVGIHRLGTPWCGYHGVLTPAEVARLRELPECIWSDAAGSVRAAKRAVRRAGGAPELGEFAVAPYGSRPVVVTWPEEGTAPLLYPLHPAPGYSATLAVHTPVEIDVCEYDGRALLAPLPARLGELRRAA